MKVKDFIYTSIFSALYIILMLIIVMGSSAISPLLSFIAPLIVGVVCGSVYMLCVVKVHRFGAALICGVFFTLTAELILFLGKYKSQNMYLLSFVVFNLTMAAPTMMMLFDFNRFIILSEKSKGFAYAQSLAKLAFNGKIWYVILGCSVAGGIGGALIAKNLIKTYFEKEEARHL